MTTNSAIRDKAFAVFEDIWLTQDNITHYQGLLEKQLLINRCSKCGYWVYPHRPICPECLSWELTPKPVHGKGTVYMFTLIRQGRRIDEGTYDPPRVVAAIELEEQTGLRYLSTVTGIAPSEVIVGMPVEISWSADLADPYPTFVPSAPDGESE